MLSRPELPDQEPAETPATPGLEPAKGRSRRKSLSNARRELNEKEMSSPAVQKLLLDEIERLEQECSDSASYRDRFHEADKNAAILEQKAKANSSFEVISLACISLGGAAIGYAPSLWTAQPSGYFALGLGVVLIVVGVVAEAIKP